LTASDTLKGSKFLTKEEVNILNTFRIDDLAKNRVIDTLSKYIVQDSILISKMSVKTSILEVDKELLKKEIVEKDKQLNETNSENATLHKKLKRTRKLGIAGSTLFLILGSILTLIYA
jgi:hypothetical protein